MEDIDSLRKFLDYPKDIVIFSHRNPDGDAIGSSMGLKLYLENYGHRVDIVFPSEFPSILTFLPKTDDIVIFDFEKERVQNIIDKCEMMFFLDFSSLDRVDNIGTLIIEKNVPKVHIDHHLDPEPIADYVLSDSEASSTSELVYRFFELFDNAKYINSKVAECLMTGIISDTGSFRYSVTPETFRVSSELMKTGLDLTSLQNHIYNSYSEKQLRLVGYVIHNKLEIIPEYKTAIMSLSKQDYKDFNIQRGDTEGLVNYMLMMRDIMIAALITEQPTITKVSLRSKGDFSVQDIAKKYFKGGGHLNASGGQSFKPLEKVIEKFKSILPDYKSEIEANSNF